MTTYKLCSNFAELLERYIQRKIDQKHLENNYRTNASIFDKWCLKNYPEAKVIDKDLAWNYFMSAKDLSSQYQHIKACFIRQFAKFLLDEKIDAYVLPTSIERRVDHMPPHIITMEEIVRFFEATEKLMKLKASHLKATRFSLPPLFLTMLTLGLRPTEALRVKIDDVDLDSGKVFIRESKGWAQRFVIMKDSTLEQCRNYNEIISNIFPKRQAFFAFKDGGFITHKYMHWWFSKIWDFAQLPRPAGERCSPYSFRHSFAVHRLNQWSKEGADVEAMLDRLSLFMGHINIAHTAYYLHFEQSYYVELENKMSLSNKAVLPKVVDYDK